MLNDFFIFEETVVWTHDRAEDAAKSKTNGSGLIGISKEFLNNVSKKQLGYDQCDDSS